MEEVASRRPARVISTALTVFIVVAWFFLLRPQTLGGPASYIRVSGISMTPTMHSGDLAVAIHGSSYHLGEVIVYKVPAGEIGAGLNVIHRIVGGNGAAGWTTKGDHNGYTDRWHPKNSDVLGKVTVRVPGVYRWLSQLRHPIVLAVLVGLLTFTLMLWPSKTKEEMQPSVEPAPAPVRTDIDRPSVGGLRIPVIRVGWLIVGAHLVAGVFTVFTKAV